MMNAIDGAVDAVPFIVVVLTERFEQTLKGNDQAPRLPALDLDVGGLMELDQVTDGVGEDGLIVSQRRTR